MTKYNLVLSVALLCCTSCVSMCLLGDLKLFGILIFFGFDGCVGALPLCVDVSFVGRFCFNVLFVLFVIRLFIFLFLVSLRSLL